MPERPPTALITGASRGLGRAIALAFGAEGFRVVLVARSEEGLLETQRQLEATGSEALVSPADLSDPGRIDALVSKVEEWTGSVDVLVNNAGVIEPLGPFAETSFEAWATSVRINMEGTARVTHALLPLLRKAPRARIITISSGAAVSDIAGWSAYCTSKAAMDRFACVLDAELKAQNIRSHSFAPGTIETEMQRSIRSTGVGPAGLVEGRVEHLPAEVPAKAVVFLSTPSADSLAGRHIDIRYPEVRDALGLPPL